MGSTLRTNVFLSTKNSQYLGSREGAASAGMELYCVYYIHIHIYIKLIQYSEVLPGTAGLGYRGQGHPHSGDRGGQAAEPNSRH